MTRDRAFHRSTRIHRDQRSMRITSTWGIFGRYTIGTLTRHTFRLAKGRPGNCIYGCCRKVSRVTERPTSGLMVLRSANRKPILQQGKKS